jgi:hypothetical protein
MMVYNYRFIPNKVSKIKLEIAKIKHKTRRQAFMACKPRREASATRFSLLDVWLTVAMLVSFSETRQSKFDFLDSNSRLTNFDTSFANDKRFTIFLIILSHEGSATRNLTKEK